MAVEASVFKIVYNHFRKFIAWHPMAAFFVLIILSWIPLIRAIIDGRIFEPKIHFLVIEFEYANIPIGLTILFIIMLPLHHWYLKPFDRKQEQLIADQQSKAYQWSKKEHKEIYDSNKKRLDDIFKNKK